LGLYPSAKLSAAVYILHGRAMRLLS